MCGSVPISGKAAIAVDHATFVVVQDPCRGCAPPGQRPDMRVFPLETPVAVG